MFLPPRIQRILATAVALLVLSVGTGFASTVFRCGIDGKARDVCCCPGKAKGTKAKAPVSPDPVASRACCCQVEMKASTAAEARIEAERSTMAQLAMPPATITIAIAPAAPIAIARPTPYVDDHPAIGPPLFYRHCSLLL